MGKRLKLLQEALLDEDIRIDPLDGLVQKAAHRILQLSPHLTFPALQL